MNILITMNHMLKLPTWSPHVDVHAVIFNFALRRSGSDGGDAQVSGVQVLLGPLAVVRLVANIKHSLLIKLLKHRQHDFRQGEVELKLNYNNKIFIFYQK